jgi:hypothetical protein
MTGLLQDEAEGYEGQRLSKWFASRLDARVVVRRYHERTYTHEIEDKDRRQVLQSNAVAETRGL